MLQWKDFLKQKRWKQMKKSDWVVIALFGVLLLVITMPSAEQHDSPADDGEAGSTYAAEEDEGEKQGSTREAQTAQEHYVEYMEERLEAVLAQMEGVGDVEVMLTVSDTGEYVVEKDAARTETVTTENDSVGGSRTVSEHDTKEQTIFVETGNESYPYIQKELLPTVVGVVVVAEGGGSPVVVSNISEAVQALLPIEAHRIKVVKMCSKEE